jgi:2-polyprenyl-3-methyl-5-hydroxy-6-metoxy-1,4-benzoquinol methylase
MNHALKLQFRRAAGQLVHVPLGGKWAAEADRASYRDTAANTLRAIIAAVEEGKPWREVIAEHYAQINPWLHAIVTSPTRDLFFRLHPPAAGARVLDLGSGWGQIALPLARRGDLAVTALEPTPERLDFIHAVARQEGLANRMHFLQTDFQSVEFGPEFDLVICVGVLEWVPKFAPGEPRAVQLDFLRRVRRALRPGGALVVGIENRLGLKYLLGARDDHTGQRQISVLDAHLAAARHQAATGEELRAFTYSLEEYLKLFREAGFATIGTHGAFPDYKLPQLILSCDDVPAFNRQLGDTPLPPEHDGIDGQILPDAAIFRSHYYSLARLGVAHVFCPSYFFELR